MKSKVGQASDYNILFKPETDIAPIIAAYDIAKADMIMETERVGMSFEYWEISSTMYKEHPNFLTLKCATCGRELSRHSDWNCNSLPPSKMWKNGGFYNKVLDIWLMHRFGKLKGFYE